MYYFLRKYWLLIVSCALITVGTGFIYFASPLRSPSFVPMGANAGTLIPWLRGFSEENWKLGYTLLAGAIASMLTAFLRQFNGSSRRELEDVYDKYVRWLLAGTGLFMGIWLFFGFCLLGQWIID